MPDLDALAAALNELPPKARFTIYDALPEESRPVRCHRRVGRAPQTTRCGRLIVGRRTDALFCSPTCQDSEKTRKRRERGFEQRAAARASDHTRPLTMGDLEGWAGPESEITSARVRRYLRSEWGWGLGQPIPDAAYSEVRDGLVEWAVEQGFDLTAFGTLLDEVAAS